MDIWERLKALSDAEYAVFEAKLAPTVPKECCLGVRVPALRKFERQIRGTEEAEAFLETLPHAYYDENMLHALLLTDGKDYAKTLRAVDAFLPCIDNWAVCDTLAPKVFAKHRQELLPEIKRWIASDAEFVCRFGIGMLMRHFLDRDFRAEYLDLPASVQSDHYYVNMMIAWFFATALAKQYDAALPYLEERRLSAWVHNKTIQKAVESFQVDADKKAYLKTLRVKRT